MKQHKTIQKLHSFFSGLQNEPSIDLAYVFGSRASGKQGPISDCDIAVLCSDSYASSLRYELAHKLTAMLKTVQVDLVLLNEAPIELRYAIIACGMVVYEINVKTRVEFEAITLSLYGDYLPVLRNQRADILKEDDNEAGVQRYRKALGETQRLLEKIRTV